MLPGINGLRSLRGPARRGHCHGLSDLSVLSEGHHGRGGNVDRPIILADLFQYSISVCVLAYANVNMNNYDQLWICNRI